MFDHGKLFILIFFFIKHNIILVGNRDGRVLKILFWVIIRLLTISKFFKIYNVSTSTVPKIINYFLIYLSYFSECTSEVFTHLELKKCRTVQHVRSEPGH